MVVAMSVSSTPFFKQDRMPRLRLEDITVAWLCAKHIERQAAEAMLDKELHKSSHPNLPESDHNSYTFGVIGEHYVAIAGFAKAGPEEAVKVACSIKDSFPKLKVRLMVGIGGAAPTAKNDIRLGDVVVSYPKKRESGVLQYDHGKHIQGMGFQITSHMDKPDEAILRVIQTLRARHGTHGNRLAEAAQERVTKSKKLRLTHSKPKKTDRLYETTYDHNRHTPCDCRDVTTSIETRQQRFLITRHREPRLDTNEIKTHYGLIASGNGVVQDPFKRDAYALEHKVLCFEMEAAGLVNTFPCIVIRGISDYCDSHKNDDWQGYASTTAAAYARELLEEIPGHPSLREENDQRTAEPASQVVLSNSMQSVSIDEEDDEAQPLDTEALYTKLKSYRKHFAPSGPLASCMKMLKDNEELLLPGIDYWSHMTREGYFVYVEILEHMHWTICPINIITFAKYMGSAGPPADLLIRCWRLFREPPGDLKPLPGHYLLALLYMLHMCRCNENTSEHFLPMSGDQEAVEFDGETLARLQCLTHWEPCTSPSDACGAFWNFGGPNWGILDDGGNHLDECLVYNRWWERNNSRMIKAGEEMDTRFLPEQNEVLDTAWRDLRQRWLKNGQSQVLQNS